MQDQSEPTMLVATRDIPFPGPDARTPTPKVHRRRLPFVLAGVGALGILLAAGGLLANAALSQAYSPRQAVRDYFSALRHRDADGMLSNATFVRGEGAYSYFFGKLAVQNMLQLPANSDLKNISIKSERVIDDSSREITVSMIWNGKNRSQTLIVRKDPSRVHWLLYPSWRVEIPSTLIRVTLPNQPGLVSLDGIPAPNENQTAVLAIQGFHEVAMAQTAFYDIDSQSVDATDSPAAVTFKGTIKPAALQLVNQAIKDGLVSNSCDASKYDGCFNHTYNAPDRNFIYYFTLPGYGNVSYNSYVDTLTNDPTAGIKLTVEAATGKVSVSGTCNSTVRVDGARSYTMKGDYSGTLTWNGGGFDSDLTWDCEKARA
jgi:hypothetical protein